MLQRQDYTLSTYHHSFIHWSQRWILSQAFSLSIGEFAFEYTLEEINNWFRLGDVLSREWPHNPGRGQHVVTHWTATSDRFGHGLFPPLKNCIWCLMLFSLQVLFIDGWLRLQYLHEPPGFRYVTLYLQSGLRRNIRKYMNWSSTKHERRIYVTS